MVTNFSIFLLLYNPKSSPSPYISKPFNLTYFLHQITYETIGKVLKQSCSPEFLLTYLI